LDCSLFAPEVEWECLDLFAQFEVLLILGWGLEIFVEGVDLDMAIFVARDKGILAMVETRSRYLMALRELK
jgi:hypothetical protein